MLYYEVAPAKIVRQDSFTYTYSSHERIEIGSIVMISLGKRNLVGVVIREVSRPEYATKLIDSLIESKPLPKQLIELAIWISEYYVTHLALVLQMILPSGIQKKRRQSKKRASRKIRKNPEIRLNKHQSAAVHTILTGKKSGTFLLHGVTGSGKTAVYIEIVKKAIENNQSAVVLVPEIALTAQVVDEFSTYFSNLTVVHSTLTESERHTIWKKVLEDDSPQVIIGPRSALFQPIRDIGIVIVDEAHEPSYKQEQSPKYSALRAAKILANAHNAKLILGSATPSISDYYIAKNAHHTIVVMPESAKKTKKPTLIIVDMKNRQNFKNHRFLSDIFVDSIEKTLHDGYQVLIFHNRRGSSPINICDKCGWQALCPRCFVPLTLHADQYILRCHICNHQEKTPTQCPMCRNASIVHRGVGTKLIEAELTRLFPDVKIGRFDGDSNDTVNSKYDEIYNGEIDIIIGTQVVAKGLDLPKLRMVGVVQADSGLSLPDYSAEERTFQLIAQVAGRVGRSNDETSVIIQSYQPQHIAITAGLSQDYNLFYENALLARKKSAFPPFSHVLKLTCSYKTEQAAIRNSRALAIKLRHSEISGLDILGPVPAFYERQGGLYRWQLVIKSKKRSELVKVLNLLPKSNWQFDLDPSRLI